jgi:hypothetical protein
MKPAIGRSVSPYPPQNVDVAIRHLVRVLFTDVVDLVFDKAYWRGRVIQTYATRGLMPAQQERLQLLLERLESPPAAIHPRTRVA